MKDSFWFQHDSNAQHDERVLELRAEYGWEGYGLFWGLVEKMRDCPDYRLSMATVGGLSAGMGVLKPLLLGIIDLACKYGLLATEENGAYFYSPSLRRRMGQWDDKKASLSEAGRIGAERKKALKEAATLAEQLREVEATLKPPLSHPDTFASTEDKRTEDKRTEEPLSLRSEGAASEPEKKIGQELPSQSQPAGASHTEGAADVATRKPAIRFTPPAYDELLAHMMQQRPDNAPAEVERVAAKCFGYYAGNGWKVGRNPMKDWKGACQTFLADLPKAAPGQPQAPMATAYRQDFQRPQPVSQVEKRMSLSAQLREKYQPQS